MGQAEGAGPPQLQVSFSQREYFPITCIDLCSFSFVMISRVLFSCFNTRCISHVGSCFFKDELFSFYCVGFGLDRGSTLVCSSALCWGMDASSRGTVCSPLKITTSTSSQYVHSMLKPFNA